MTNSRERLALIDKAIATIESGAQEYRIGTLHIVRGDLGRLYAERRNLISEIANEEGGWSYVAVFDGR